jgi:predicted  nucleic acid-binding Zn-ribbon protein
VNVSNRSEAHRSECDQSKIAALEAQVSLLEERLRLASEAATDGVAAIQRMVDPVVRSFEQEMSRLRSRLLAEEERQNSMFSVLGFSRIGETTDSASRRERQLEAIVSQLRKSNAALRLEAVSAPTRGMQSETFRKILNESASMYTVLQKQAGALRRRYVQESAKVSELKQRCVQLENELSGVRCSEQSLRSLCAKLQQENERLSNGLATRRSVSSVSALLSTACASDDLQQGFQPQRQKICFDAVLYEDREGSFPQRVDHSRQTNSALDLLPEVDLCVRQLIDAALKPAEDLEMVIEGHVHGSSESSDGPGRWREQLNKRAMQIELHAASLREAVTKIQCELRTAAARERQYLSTILSYER